MTKFLFLLWSSRRWSCRVQLGRTMISAAQHRTYYSGVHQCRIIRTWCQTAVVPDVTCNIVGAWPPTSSDNSFTMSPRCCSCIQSTTVWRRASTFSSISFSFELLGLSCFTKMAEYCLDFQIPCLPMHSYCISQLSNNLCPVFFLRILWWSQSGDYLVYDKNNRILLCSLLPTGTYHKKSGEFGQNFPWKSFVWSKSYFQVEIWQNFANKKTLALPQCAFQVQKSKLHTLAIFKTWPEWTSTHQGTMLRMDCMWYW